MHTKVAYREEAYKVVASAGVVEYIRSVYTKEANMARKSYYELLKHPKWQAKRLEVLNRAEFRCQWCGDDETTLHVHHALYRKGAAPWEYEPHELVCVCEACHAEAHDVRAELDLALGMLNAVGGNDALWRIAGYARAVLAGHLAHREPRGSYFEVRDVDGAIGVADYFGLPYMAAFDAAERPGDPILAYDWHDLATIAPRFRKED